MGYRTEFTLYISDIDEKALAYVVYPYLQEKDLLGYVFEDDPYEVLPWNQKADPERKERKLGWVFPSRYEAKWYDFADDMIELSRRVPNATFMLYGQGELNGDQWREYFKNGQAERVFAVFPDPTSMDISSFKQVDWNF